MLCRGRGPRHCLLVHGLRDSCFSLPHLATCACIMDWLELVSGGGVPMVRDARNGLPDVVESGWSGRRLADNSRFRIASAFMALGVGLVIAILAGVHYYSQANGLQRLLRSPRSSATLGAGALPRVSSSNVALPEDGPIRGKVAMVMVDHMSSGNAELLITAYISGGRPRTRYALMGSNCLSNGADHLWASGVTNNQGIAVLTGRPWTSNVSDYYWTWTQRSAGTTPPPVLHGPSATHHAIAFKADHVLCAPYQLHGRFKIIS
jgi:hypothetical protein